MITILFKHNVKPLIETLFNLCNSVSYTSDSPDIFRYKCAVIVPRPGNNSMKYIHN